MDSLRALKDSKIFNNKFLDTVDKVTIYHTEDKGPKMETKIMSTFNAGEAMLRRGAKTEFPRHIPAQMEKIKEK